MLLAQPSRLALHALSFAIARLYPGVTLSLADGSLLDNSGLQSLYHAGSDIVICNEMTAPLEDLKRNIPEVHIAAVSQALGHVYVQLCHLVGAKGNMHLCVSCRVPCN